LAGGSQGRAKAGEYQRYQVISNVATSSTAINIGSQGLKSSAPAMMNGKA